RVIDKTNIIPFLLSFLNAIPVKRPFRDNAKELVKSGNLKNLIEENWRTIAKHIQDGKNIFLFPEGTYTYNGFVNSPRKGIYLLKEYVPELKVINVSLSYDSLSFRKMDLHLTLGKMEIFPTELSKENISDFIRDKIAKDIVITHGNLVSFLFFQNIFREGILLQNWKELLDCFILKLRKEKDFFISKRFDSPNSSQIANRILEDARQSGFLVYKENKIYSTEKLLEKPETLNTEFLKKNPYLYHKNQLNYHWTKLTEIYSNCLEKILT
ncbi:MAG: hypothetical protein IT215_03700, partial [Chitinophagaceae bacterium]|nr:hypothetical protein [Chitinophagaceae bacterium]